MQRLKTHAFYLMLKPDPEQLETIRSTMSQYAGVEQCVSRGNTIKISYDLNVCGYNDIKSYLKKITTLKPESTVQRQLAHWIGYRENNEMAHSRVSGGWGYYVRRFYLSLESNKYP